MDKVVELLGEVSVINVAYPVYFFGYTFNTDYLNRIGCIFKSTIKCLLAHMSMESTGLVKTVGINTENKSGCWGTNSLQVLQGTRSGEHLTGF